MHIDVRRLSFLIYFASSHCCRNRSDHSSLRIPLLPADLANVRVILTDLNTAQRALSTELENADALNEDDAFPKQMIRFSKEAKERLALLTDVVAEASGAYAKALSFYGEDSKSITSTAEFFAVFKTFVTSYQVSSFFLLPFR